MQRIYLRISVWSELPRVEIDRVAEEVAKFPHVLVVDVFDDGEDDIVAIAQFTNDLPVEEIAAALEGGAQGIADVADAYTQWTRSDHLLITQPERRSTFQRTIESDNEGEDNEPAGG